MAKRATRRRSHDDVETSYKKTNLPFPLEDIQPITNTQTLAFQSYNAGDNLLLYGTAGTGKTFIALYLALRQLASSRTIKKVVIIRSAVSSRDMGFMPGNVEQKSKLYEDPYALVCSQLFGRDDAYGVLKAKHQVEFRTTSFCRGITLDNAIVILDEVQNMTFDEIHTVMTRIGKGSRIIVLGDIKQNDLPNNKQKQESGFHQLLKILPYISSGFSALEFGIEDIVRSGFVKQWIIACERYTSRQSTPDNRIDSINSKVVAIHPRHDDRYSENYTDFD